MRIEFVLAGAIAALGWVRPQHADEPALTLQSGSTPLLELVERVHTVTGETFFFDLRDLRGGVSITVAGTVQIAKPEVLVWFDECLREVDFVRLQRTVGGRTVHALRRLSQQSRGQQALKTMARIVSREELRVIADRGELVTTTWGSRHSDEALDDGICVYFGDSTMQSVRGIDGTCQLVMTGRANEIARSIEILERVDAEHATNRAKEPDLLAERLAALEQRITALERGARPSER